MKTILKQINTVEGVMGSSVFNQQGELLSEVFTANVSSTAKRQIADLVLDCIQEMQSPETRQRFELQSEGGRIIIRAFPEIMLCLLCSNSVNINLLNMTLNLVGRKIEHLNAPIPDPVKSSPVYATGAAQLNRGQPLRLIATNLVNSAASSSFDSLGMIAVSHSTANHIREFYQADFKKLSLLSQKTNSRGVFPVMVINDLDASFHNTIIVGPGIEKRLQIGKGDFVEVQIG